MGTFGGYSGPEIISVDKIEEFSNAVSKILYYGGMMHLRNVEMYSKKIILLDPVTIKTGEDVDFYYNYFEEDSWENAGYIYGRQHFYTNKIGSNEFNYVVTAVRCLYELYDEGVGLADINDEIVSSAYYTGWINHLLDADFSINRRFNLWEVVESYAFEHLEYNDEPIQSRHLMGIIPSYLMQYAGGVDLTDLLYIDNGTEALCEAEVMAGTYPADVLKCKKAIEGAVEKCGAEEAYSLILEMLKKEYSVRESGCQEYIQTLAECSLSIHARTILYLTCELLDKHFWVEWKSVKDEVYNDEKMPKYASDELLSYRKEGRERPIRKIKTSEFLKNDGYFTFYGTPDELKGYPNYYISDADRLFWWDGSDEVEINDETEKWLNKRVEEYKEALKGTPDECDTQQFVKKLIDLLFDVESRYKRVFAFQDMFYEFIANGSKKEYRAAVEVLRKLYDDNAEAGKIIEKVRGSWDLASKNVTCNRGRMNMRRYLALLANVELRKKYLGF